MESIREKDAAGATERAIIDAERGDEEEEAAAAGKKALEQQSRVAEMEGERVEAAIERRR